jgi:N-acyl-D-aspartate/D-glutamate deacylase
MLHRALDGEPVPGTFAGADELIGIAQGMQSVGGGMFELATDLGLGSMDGRFSEDFGWMLQLAKDSQLAVTYILGQADRAPNEWRKLLEMTDAARSDGANIKALVSGRPPGMLLGFQTSLNPFQAHPTYMKFANLEFAHRVAALRLPENRAALLRETTTFTGQFNLAVASGFAKMFPLGDPPDYEPTPDKSIAAIAQRQGRSADEVCLDYLLKDEGREMLYYPLQNYAAGDFEVLREMLEAQCTVLSLSDGGAHCGLICDASTPSYILTHWVRDRTRGPRLELEQAVKYQTRDTALTYGLADRGLLKAGFKADANVIDIDNMRLHPPYMVDDLPANGRRLMQKADGYLATIIAGATSWRNSEPTGAMPGKLIRGPQSA